MLRCRKVKLLDAVCEDSLHCHVISSQRPVASNSKDYCQGGRPGWVFRWSHLWLQSAGVGLGLVAGTPGFVLLRVTFRYSVVKPELPCKVAAGF